MGFSLYDATIPTFCQMLAAVDGLLDKGAAHCAQQGIAPGTIIEARLAPDLTIDSWRQWVYEWDTTGLAPGDHTIQVRATDATGAPVARYAGAEGSLASNTIEEATTPRRPLSRTSQSPTPATAPPTSIPLMEGMAPATLTAKTMARPANPVLIVAANNDTTL